MTQSPGDNAPNTQKITQKSTQNNQQAHTPTPLSYADAGVDIDAGNALVERIKPACKATARPEVMGSIGGFGGLCRIPKGYESPILVSATDGVGTKLRLAIDHQAYSGVGIDLVAMCVNDLIVCGAEPLFFLDYYATGQLDVEAAARVVESISTGCQQAGCALTGGETAEMPGMYHKNDFDLAGFCVGVVEEARIIDGQQVQSGDQLVALKSSGAHANGFSLIRKVIEQANIDPKQLPLEGQPLIDLLLEPTKIYVKSILALCKRVHVKALAHITGGGLPENLPRVLPKNHTAVIDTQSWQWPALFKWLAETGNIATHEMRRTFNCGVGMVLVVAESELKATLDHLNNNGENAWHIGSITSSSHNSSAHKTATTETPRVHFK